MGRVTITAVGEGGYSLNGSLVLALKEERSVIAVMAAIVREDVQEYSIQLHLFEGCSVPEEFLKK